MKVVLILFALFSIITGVLSLAVSSSATNCFNANALYKENNMTTFNYNVAILIIQIVQLILSVGLIVYAVKSS